MKKNHSFPSILKRLRDSERGSVLIELAIVTPVIMVLVLGGFEVSRYALLNQKIDRLAVSVADLASQAEELSASDVDDLFLAVEHIAEPFDIANSSIVILTSVSRTEGADVVNWQSDHGGYSATSRIGVSGGSANLPDGFTLRDGETVIIAEVFLDYEPMLVDSFVGSREIYDIALFRPRLGTLDELI